MKENIWIFHQYATTPNKGGLVRPYDFSQQLKKKGYSPLIFSSAFNHYTHETISTGTKKYIEKDENGVPFVYIKSIPYVHNDLRRVFNMIAFFFSLFFITKKYTKDTNKKPHTILASSPHPFICIAGIFIAKRYNVPCIVEIRDLWPESIVAYLHKFSKKNILVKLMYMGEKWIYKKADKLVFTVPGGAEYIKEKGWEKAVSLDKVFHINNGVDVALFDANKKEYKIKDKDLENKNLFTFVYTGSIRRINSLDILLDIAKKVRNKNIKFLIWGTGDKLEGLQQRLIDEKITNVAFKGRVEKKYIPYILSKASVNLCHNEYTNLFRFGISFNKLFDYYASGRPLLMDFTPNFNPIELYKCGTNSSYENFTEKVEWFYALPKTELEKLGKNARKAALAYDFKVLTEKLITIIEGDT